MTFIPYENLLQDSTAIRIMAQQILKGYEMSEFIVVTWAAVQDRLEQHDKAVGRILDFWRKNAKRFKLKCFWSTRQTIDVDNLFPWGQSRKPEHREHPEMMLITAPPLYVEIPSPEMVAEP
jgi:hypothetical protein